MDRKEVEKYLDEKLLEENEKLKKKVQYYKWGAILSWIPIIIFLGVLFISILFNIPLNSIIPFKTQLIQDQYLTQLILTSLVFVLILMAYYFFITFSKQTDHISNIEQSVKKTLEEQIKKHLSTRHEMITGSDKILGAIKKIIEKNLPEQEDIYYFGAANFSPTQVELDRVTDIIDRKEDYPIRVQYKNIVTKFLEKKEKKSKFKRYIKFLTKDEINGRSKAYLISYQSWLQGQKKLINNNNYVLYKAKRSQEFSGSLSIIIQHHTILIMIGTPKVVDQETLKSDEMRGFLIEDKTSAANFIKSFLDYLDNANEANKPMRIEEDNNLKDLTDQLKLVENKLKSLSNQKNK